MQTDLVQYLPEWFREIKDFDELMLTESEEFEALSSAMSAVRNNFYVQTADAGTILEYESLFGIIPSPTESLEFRRARILNRLSTQPPFTMRFLYDKLDKIIGVGKWSVIMDYSAYTLYVEAAAENQEWANEIHVTLNTIKPCHIVYISRPLLADSVLMSEEIRLSEGDYKYRLGAWGLGLNPFIRYTDKGVIVTKEQMTITDELINDVAEFTASDIASVQLNDTVAITTFEVKEAVGNLVTIQYSVLEEQVQTITKVELLSADNRVLTSAPVYVPIQSSAQLRHTITTKEGT